MPESQLCLWSFIKVKAVIGVLLLIVALVFLAVLFSALALGGLLDRNRRVTRARLAAYASGLAGSVRSTAGEEELARPFGERVVLPFLGRLGQALGRFLPEGQKSSLERRLVLAGLTGRLGATEFLALQYALAAVLCVLLGLLGLVAGGSPLLGLLGLAAGYILPQYLVKRRAEARGRQVVRALPDTIDLLTVSVEAGLGFDAALGRVAARVKGPLSDELSRALEEMQLGRSRHEALRALSERCPVSELKSFVGAVIQADQLGVNMGRVLRVQSADLRRRRRQRAEEQAMQAPIKMLIPLVLLIFPSLFVVLLAPALMDVFKILGSMSR